MARHSQRKLAQQSTFPSIFGNTNDGHRSHTHKAHIHGNGNLPYGIGHRENRQNQLIEGNHRVHSHQAHIHGNSELPYGVSRRQYRKMGRVQNRRMRPIGLILLGLAGAGLVSFIVIRRRRSVLFRKQSIITGNTGVQYTTNYGTGLATSELAADYGTINNNAYNGVSGFGSTYNNNVAYNNAYNGVSGLGATSTFSNSGRTAFSGAPAFGSTATPAFGTGSTSGRVSKGLLGGLATKALASTVTPSRNGGIAKKLVKAGLVSFVTKKILGHGKSSSKNLKSHIPIAPIAAAAAPIVAPKLTSTKKIKKHLPIAPIATAAAPGMVRSSPKKSKKFLLLAPILPLLAIGGAALALRNRKPTAVSPIPQHATLVQPVPQHATLVEAPVQPQHATLVQKKKRSLFRLKKVKKTVVAEQEVIVAEPVVQTKVIETEAIAPVQQTVEYDVEEVPVIQKTSSRTLL